MPKSKREYNKWYFEKMYQERPIHYLLKAAKARAKQKGLVFDLVSNARVLSNIRY